MAGDLITGATGFVGFRVLILLLQAGYRARISIRRESSVKDIKGHHLIAPYADSVEFVIVKDITADGAFDSALEGVKYIEHIASPLPSGTEDVEIDIIVPAIRGTVSILNSAIKFPSIQRVVITSSVVGIIPPAALMGGDEVNTYTAYSRVKPLPVAPWGSAAAAYFSSKTLALHETELFIEEKKPHFSIVNVMPGFIVGRNELATTAEELLSGTNIVALGPVLGHQMTPRPCQVVDVRDVARIHVEALNESKVVGNKSFLLDAGRTKFEDSIVVADEEFPEAVKSGILPLGGSLPSVYTTVNTNETTETFGKLHSYTEAAKEIIGQYLELKIKA